LRGEKEMERGEKGGRRNEVERGKGDIGEERKERKKV
jgi:hypothetical protein